MIIPVVTFVGLHVGVAGEPDISASPADLPYVNAPNMSSFFPSNELPLSSAAAPSISGDLAPVPASGEFVGKISSYSRPQISSVAVAFSCLLGFAVSM